MLKRKYYLEEEKIKNLKIAWNELDERFEEKIDLEKRVMIYDEKSSIKGQILGIYYDEKRLDFYLEIKNEEIKKEYKVKIIGENLDLILLPKNHTYRILKD